VHPCASATFNPFALANPVAVKILISVRVAVFVINNRFVVMPPFRRNVLRVCLLLVAVAPPLVMI
jgi:hypothetical protein